MYQRKTYLKVESVEAALRRAKLLTKNETIEEISLDRGMVVVKLENRKEK